MTRRHGALLLSLLAAAFALVSGGCVAGPCLCDDEELFPHRYGRDGRSSADLGPDQGAPRPHPTVRAPAEVTPSKEI